jgi:hypothetical protein
MYSQHFLVLPRHVDKMLTIWATNCKTPNEETGNASNKPKRPAKVAEDESPAARRHHRVSATLCIDGNDVMTPRASRRQ